MHYEKRREKESVGVICFQNKTGNRVGWFVVVWCGDNQGQARKVRKILIEVHPSLIKLYQYKKAQELWNTLRGDNEKLMTEIIRLKSRASEIKSRHIKSFFVKSIAKAFSSNRKSRKSTESRKRGNYWNCCNSSWWWKRKWNARFVQT